MSRKTFTGVVTSNKMNKTVVVSLEMSKSHPLYDKKVKVTKKIMAHTEEKINEGDIVTVQESKPYSKNVKFEVISVTKEDK